MASGFHALYSGKLPAVSGFGLLLAVCELLPQHLQLIQEVIKNKLQIGRQLLEFMECLEQQQDF